MLESDITVTQARFLSRKFAGAFHEPMLQLYAAELVEQAPAGEEEVGAGNRNRRLAGGTSSVRQLIEKWRNTVI
jgi:hypothetical protein